NVPARSATSRALPASYFMAREPNKSRKNGAADSQAFMTPLRVFAAARRHKSWATNPGPQSWATILGHNPGLERAGVRTGVDCARKQPYYPPSQRHASEGG